MKRILVPVDGSAQGLAAVKAAVAECRGNVSRIDLVHVAPTLNRHVSRFVPKAERDGWREERARAALDPARRLVESAGIACNTHVTRGPLVTALADTARLLGVQEIVLTATRRGPLAQFLANSLSTRLIERTSVPVRVVPTSAASPFERMAVPTGVAAGFALLAFAIED
ncbi:MAG: universal stress protein [Betaproteobacteria bacterium]|nr:universal stress protein [Betaproteobacteria bacterium]